MSSRFAVHAVLATLIVGGFAFAADALVVSDEEAVEELADALAEGGSDEVADWVDLTRAPLRIQTDGRAVVYDEGDEIEAGDALAEALAPFAGEVEVVQRSASVDGDRATVALRVRSEGELHDATFHLARGGSSWQRCRSPGSTCVRPSCGPGGVPCFRCP